MFRMMFGSLPTSANIVAETKFCFTESKNVSTQIQIFLWKQCFSYTSLRYVSDVSRKIDFPIRHT